MRYLLSVAALLCLSVPAMAQEEATPVPTAESSAAATAEITPTRLDLAKQMHEIWPIRTRIETAIESVSEGFAPERKAEVKAAMRKAIQFDQVEEASIRAMAETFSEEELKAMIAFYGSDTGRAISAKTGDYERSIRPILTQMLDKAMLDLRTGQKP